MSPILNSQNEFLIMEIPIFFGLIALEMIFSKFVKKMSGHFEPFPVLESIQNGQI